MALSVCLFTNFDMVLRDVYPLTPWKGERLRVKPPKEVAAGLRGVTESFKIGLAESGLIGTIRTMRTVNDFSGFDCPGCAWPDPDGHRSGFEFCENGAKAFATEATKKRVTRSFFEKNSVEDLSRKSDIWLDKQGRLTEPMILREGEIHYQPISWADAFREINSQIESAEPHECALYTSGRASNEAAFLWASLARRIGTNNLPDCSNMCHESSGYGLSRAIGIGKGTVRLSCFEKADLVIVMGQNPGTNHPRMLSALVECKRNGGSVVSINPLEETGMKRFKHPQELIRLLGKGTQIADDHFSVNIGGDAALLKGVCKRLIETDSIDSEYIDRETVGYESFRDSLVDVDWSEIEVQSGISRTEIEGLADSIAKARNMIVCWAMGVTQHKNSVAVVQEIVNLLLLGGHFGRPGAGACPVRGHSNVQGDRTVGINHHVSQEYVERLHCATGIDSPIQPGLDSVETVKAMCNGDIKMFMALGGNFLSAMSDTHKVAEGLARCDLTVQISTKLNRSHLVTGKSALILPCLGRTEIDVQKAGAQFVSVENSMGVVHSSRGVLRPASKSLRSEVSIICGIAQEAFPEDKLGWGNLVEDYSRIRSLIEQVIPGFEDYEERVIKKEGFYLPNSVRDATSWDTASGKAEFNVHQLPDLNSSKGNFTMMTVRSHDQYNTTIYGMDDRYRGIYGARRIVMMNSADMKDMSLKEGSMVTIVSHWDDGIREAVDWKVVAIEIPRGNVSTYFPEANSLIPLGSTADGSNTPTSKSVRVSIVKQDRIITEV